jgi:hypothetical protein
MRGIHASLLLTLLAGCGEELFLMHEQRLSTPEQNDLPVGGGCESIDGDDGSAHGAGGLGTASFVVDHRLQDGDGVIVLVRDGNGRPLASRVYNDEFLRSREVDEFSVELGAGNTLHLRYWGGTSCEEPRAPEG